MLKRFADIKKVYNEFPRLYWVIVMTHFIDRLGDNILYPFFALYVTQKFGVGMTEAGLLMGTKSVFNLMGSMAGGALTDRFGRRQIILFGLVFSALTSLSLGLANSLSIMFLLVTIVGLFASVANQIGR